MENCIQQVAEAKRVTSVDDIIRPVAQEREEIALLLEQAGIQNQEGLYRDHNSPNDPWIELNATVDLKEGTVFRTGKPPCNPNPHSGHSKSKHVVTCDDKPAYIVEPLQTGASMRRLFNLDPDRELLLDRMTPHDQVISDDETIDIRNGNVFITRNGPEQGYCINIEGKKYTWPSSTITTAEIRDLGNLPPDQPVIMELPNGDERTLKENETVQIDSCCRFGRAPKYKRG